METNLSQEDLEKLNSLHEQGCQLSENLVLSDQQNASKPNWFAQKKLNKAIDRFKEVLTINPQNWSAHWMLGKIYQRMNQHGEALEHFEFAFFSEPDEVDVAREAGITATELGQGDKAVKYLEAAHNMNPNDHGLLANLSLAYLIKGDLGKAQQLVKQSLDMEPNDSVTISISNILTQIEEKKGPLPKSMAEVMQYLS